MSALGFASASECADLASALERLRAELIASERALEGLIRTTHPTQAESARNLVHYLELRRRDIRGLQQRLMRQGLSSLGRTESHVLASVEAVLRGARALSGQPPESGAERDEAERIDRGRSTLARRTEELLGPASPGRRVRIMVTAPSEGSDEPEIIRALVENGTDALRINCAHDDEGSWARMISRFREAKPAGKVMMDLAGPKIRTGPLAPGPRVLKLRPQRDALGSVVSGALVRLAPEVRHGGPRTLPVEQEWVRGLRAGDLIAFLDARRKARTLVVQAAGEDGALAQCFETAYVVPGTRLTNARAGLTAQVGALDQTESALALWRGDRLRVTRSTAPGAPALEEGGGVATIGCTLREAFGAVAPGHRVWLDDGKIGAVIESVNEGAFVVRITHAPERGDRPARLRADKGMNFPDTALPTPALTEKDGRDLRFVAANADLVGLSFVQRPEQIREVRARLEALGAPNMGVVLKIETRAAFENLPALLLEAMRGPASGVMIARGDLAVEVGYERLAEVQEEILWMCEAAHTPVIWATQVLETLAKRGQPSRAEISDAAMGERSECVMLNKGPFVVDALRALNDILTRMEAHQYKKSAVLRALGVAGAFLGRGGSG